MSLVIKTTPVKITEMLKEFGIKPCESLGSVRRAVVEEKIIILNPESKKWIELWSGEEVEVGDTIDPQNYPIIFLDTQLFNSTITVNITKEPTFVIFKNGDRVISPVLGDCKLVDVVLYLNEEQEKDSWEWDPATLTNFLLEAWPVTYYLKTRISTVLSKTTDDLGFDFIKQFKRGEDSDADRGE